MERLSEDDLLIVRLFWSGRRLTGLVLDYVATIIREPNWRSYRARMELTA